MAYITHHRGYDEPGTVEQIEALRLPVDEFSTLQYMFTSHRPLVISDTRDDPRWTLLEPLGWIRSFASAPIIVRDAVIAFFGLESRTPGFYAEEHTSLLEAFAAHAAVAIENSRLLVEARAAYAELKRAQSQLIQSAKMAAVGELAAGVAHELNNPLTSVLGFAELLIWNADPDDPESQDLTVIIEEARRARDIVRRLLDFSRQTEFYRERADLNQILGETLDLLRRQMEHSGVWLAEQFAPDLPPLRLDIGSMKQVFLNILANALYAMPQGGELTVRSERAGDEVAIRFTDTGVGISAENLARIFDPFFTTKPVGKGTGLGLSVSLGIVQEHGGRITVESQGQSGEGSTFTVWLPIEAEREV
jgi:signal transduction histidine kinase